MEQTASHAPICGSQGSQEIPKDDRMPEQNHQTGTNPRSRNAQDEVVQLVRKLLEKALEGDMTAMKLCIERILPPLKEPMEPTKVQHAIEIILKEPKWLTAEKPPVDIVTIDVNGKDLSDEQGQS